MRINTNIAALSAQRNLERTGKALARALERLSTGKRINSARDDAAGLAIASGLEATRRALIRGIQNVNEANGFLETAEGAMRSQTEIIQRMRELSLQAANGTLSTADRSYLDSEFQQLMQEYDRIISQTNFNGVKLLDGSFTATSIQVGAEAGQEIEFEIDELTSFNSLTTTEVVASGTYSRTTMSAADPTQMQSADFNNDGKLDLVVSHSTTFAYGIYIGNGNGTFQPIQTLAAANNGANVAFTDYDGDGDTDIIAASNSTTIRLFKNNGSGVFSLDQNISVFSAGSVISADVDNDGDSDFLSAGRSLRLNNGTGTFSFHSTIAATGVTHQFADVNNDGNIDYATLQDSTGIYSVHFGNGNGTFQSAFTSQVVATGALASANLVDLDLDGKLDLAEIWDGGTGVLTFFKGNGNGTFATGVNTAIGKLPGREKFADVNNDGIIDYVGGSEFTGQIEIMYGNGNGTFSMHTTIATSASPNFVGTVVGDFNSDDFNDILMTDSAANVINFLTANTTITEEPRRLTLLTKADAEDSLDQLDSMMTEILNNRSNIGAVQSRITSADAVQRNLIESLSSAESLMKDADMAAEVAELTRLQILQQSGVGVLKQANLNLQIILELLKF